MSRHQPETRPEPGPETMPETTPRWSHLPATLAAPAERAWLNELTHTGRPGDSTYYAEQCRGLGAVLELGCGSGRLLLPLLEGAERAVGVDLDAEALQRARRRLDADAAPRVELVQADMCSFRSRERFDAVVLGYNSVFALGGEAGITAALRTAAWHLRPGGTLHLDAYVLYPEDVRSHPLPPEPFAPLFAGEYDGQWVEAFEQIHPLEGLRWQMRYRYLLGDASPGGRPRRAVDVSIEHDAVTADTLIALIEHAGFAVDAVWTSFRPWTLALLGGDAGAPLVPEGGDDPIHEDALIVAATFPRTSAPESHV